VQGGSTDLALLEEKDQAISDYRSEGEKLMAKTMELEGFLKKARAQVSSMLCVPCHFSATCLSRTASESCPGFTT